MKKFSMAVSVYHITFVAAELLFLCTVLSSAQTTYHVKPDNGTPCPTESDPCLTLSQYAQDFSQYFSSEVDIVLEFLPGEHSLTTELIFTNISGVTLAGNETVLEPQSIIVCNPEAPAGFSFKNITNVHISYLAFLSCGKPGPAPQLSNAIFADTIGSFQLINTVLQGSLGTALFLVWTNATIEQSRYVNNSAERFGGALVITQSTVLFKGENLLENNSAHGDGGGIHCLDSTLHFTGAVRFSGNMANFFGGGGGAYFSSSIVMATGSITFCSNSAATYGGALSAESQTNITLSGVIIFKENGAQAAGGIDIYESSLHISGNCSFVSNVASSRGGAIGVFSGLLVLSGAGLFTHNTEELGGGGMFIANITTKLAGSFTFQNNSAEQGGGMYLEQNAVLYLEPPLQLLFDSNSATRGGAIFVEDAITLSDCFPSQTNTAQSTSESFVNRCFFQFNSSDLLGKEFIFVNNSATNAGTVLYGGKLENCTFTPGSQDSGTALEVFMNISNITNDDHNDTSIISSDPIRLCLYNHTTCDSDSNYDLDFPITTIPGAKFTIPAVAVNQANGTVPTVIRAYFIRHSGVNAELGEHQHIQPTGENFTDLEYQVFSMDNYEQLVLYPEGPCRDIGRAQRTIFIQLLPCPNGLNLSLSKCICEKRLQKFTNSCDADNGTILRDSDFWMSGLYDYHYNYEGVILHPRCPFDYCVTETIYIMLDDPSAQCAFNRAGTLCGSCQSNFSLVLGSSHCLHCSNAYLSLLLPFAVAGLALVMLILVLRLTVSVGTINGLIFYANILAVNQALFFPPEDTNILTVFIAWVNLDLGIETCFYDGMDAYARTWLQFVFPFYLWLLVAVIILASHFSQKLSRLLGTNPVSVLATIFLLSYAKLLRTIIAAFRNTFLEYPDGSRVSVWLLDGNIRYLSAKHIPLFLTALAALLFLFLPYTLFLLLGQWMLALSNRNAFSWISKPTVKTFLDAYYGPYQDKHRYWTGLLLLLRGLLFLIFAFNAVGEPSINLLCITTASLGLTIMTRFTGQIYKNLWLDALEASFILNLGILAAATHHVSLAGGNQAALIYTSVGIAFVTFIGIIVYHIYLQTQNSRLWKSCPTANVLQTTHHMIDKYRRHNENEAQSPGSETKEEVSTTTVYMELREPLLEES